MMTYEEFLEGKRDFGADAGFEPIEIPAFLFPFQKSLAEWAIRKGRAAIFADCGLGKSPMQLVWADNVIRKTGKPVLILAPLAVSWQTVQESKKFGIEAVQSRDGTIGSHITVTNYQQLHRFNPEDFSGCVCDESSILKNFDGSTRAAITEFMRMIPYRLLCTATAAPNDYIELGTSAEALGYMGYRDMITMFFRQTKKADHHAWGRMKYCLRTHAEESFWRWVCSWARACRKPIDLGFDDDRFMLPELIVREHVIEAKKIRPGFLFSLPAITLDDQREERRRTIRERCEEVARIVAEHEGCSICWGHLNDECDMLEKLIPNSVQVGGTDSDEWKEMVVEWFIGKRCICQLTTKNRSAKLAECGNKNMPTTDEGSMSPTKLNAKSVKLKPGHPKKTESTCENTISLTKENSSELRSNKPGSMLVDDENTQKTPNTGKPRKRKSKQIEKNTLKLDVHTYSESTDSHSSITNGYLPSKAGDVQSVEGNESTDLEGSSKSITAIQPGGPGESSVPNAISDSENSEMISDSSKRRSCTCGYITGKRVLISKPVIFGYGLNLQCCHHMVFFPSHSFEMYYQSVRRCYRFGQTNDVEVDLVTSEGEAGVMANMQRKSDQADLMFDSLVALMHDHLSIRRSNPFTGKAEVPEWLTR